MALPPLPLPTAASHVLLALIGIAVFVTGTTSLKREHRKPVPARSKEAVMLAVLLIAAGTAALCAALFSG